MPRKTAEDRVADAAEVAHYVAAGQSVRVIMETLGWPRWRTERAVELARITASMSPPEPDPSPEEPPRLPAEPRPFGIARFDFQESARSRHILERVVPTSSRIQRFIVPHVDPAAAPENIFHGLLTYARHAGADILIGAKRSKLKSYAEEFRPYLCPDRVRLSDSCLFVGDPGLGATAGDPVGKSMTVNGGQHVIIPHARVALRSIPRMSCHPARYAVSTGSVTVPSYSDSAAGQAALFHHVAAALMVEIDVDGEAFFRHLIADRDGRFQDLDVIVDGDRILTGQRVDGIVWADVHHDAMSRAVGLSSFGYDRRLKTATGCLNLLDWLRPSWQVMSDGLDFPSRHRMVRGSSTELARMHYLGRGDVEAEVEDVARFYRLCCRPWTALKLIEDNHGRKLVDWISQDNRRDPLPRNAEYWASLFAKKMEMIRRDPDGFRDYQIVEAALRDAGMPEDVEVVYRGQSFAPGGIECAIHSHKGLNGAAGSPAHYRGFGTRVTLGHPHTPQIDQGMYAVGTCAEIPEIWNPDASTHAHAHAVHYGTGKRCLLTMTPDGRFRAEGDRARAFQAAA